MKITTTSGTKEFSDTWDIIDFNRELLKENPEEIIEFQTYVCGKYVTVNLKEKTINFSGLEIDVDLTDEQKSQLTNMRFVNFRRNTLSEEKTVFRNDKGELMIKTSGRTRDFCHGVGFQGNINGQNIKRWIMVTRDGGYAFKNGR